MNRKIISVLAATGIAISTMSTSAMAVSGDGLIEVLNKVNSHPEKATMMDLLKSNIKTDSGIDIIKNLVDLQLSSDDKKALEKRGIKTKDIYDSLDDMKTWDTSTRINLLNYVESGQSQKAKELIEKNGIIHIEEEKKPTGSGGSSTNSSSGSNSNKGTENKKEETPKIENQAKPEVGKDSSIKFRDINGHWAESNIKKMSELKIVNGVSKDEFAPEQSVTRNQMIAMIVRMLDIDTSSDYELPFKDVNKGSWDYDLIKAAYKLNIVNGTSETTFEPNKKITREQMMVMMMNAIKYKNIQNMNNQNKALTDYKDHNKVSVWANESMQEALNMGLITGKTESIIEPQGVATRSQAVTILARAYDLLNK